MSNLHGQYRHRRRDVNREKITSKVDGEPEKGRRRSDGVQRTAERRWEKLAGCFDGVRVRRLASTNDDEQGSTAGFDGVRVRRQASTNDDEQGSTGFEFDGWLRPTTMNGGGGIGGR
ncbi:unnamed protein product [Linum trigynum]|uniref:Uncharacterized protein n=1 Tax=Linum trigynum TaxID=586398 RepID=A0AAV2C7J7_9ROSI